MIFYEAPHRVVESLRDAIQYLGRSVELFWRERSPRSMRSSYGGHCRSWKRSARAENYCEAR